MALWRSQLSPIAGGVESGRGVYVWDVEGKNTTIFFRLIQRLIKGIVIQKSWTLWSNKLKVGIDFALYNDQLGATNSLCLIILAMINYYPWTPAPKRLKRLSN